MRSPIPQPSAALPPNPPKSAARFDRLVDDAAWAARAEAVRPLILDFIDRARRDRRALAVHDPMSGPATSMRTLIGAVALARGLRTDWADQGTVGVLLPPSLGGIVANLAAALAGRTVVNLNYTAGAAGMAAAVRHAGLRTVLTSKVFLQKADLQIPEGARPIWIEEVRNRIGKAARLRAAAAALLLPKIQLLRSCGASGEMSADRKSVV